MATSKSPQRILNYLKTRGPQSVRILAKELPMTTMGVRQHLADLQRQGLVATTEAARQHRGRPLHLWKLTAAGHGQFPDKHGELVQTLLIAATQTLGSEQLDSLVDSARAQQLSDYQHALAPAGSDLAGRVQALAQQRSQEGYMAEVRLLPDGWLLIENHCPIHRAAQRCQQYCRSELQLFRDLLGEQVHIERVDHLLAGARRCAYRIRKSA